MAEVQADRSVLPDVVPVVVDYPLEKRAKMYWLGWASIVAVLAALALDGAAPHRVLLVGATAVAAGGNTLAMIVPWREWLATLTMATVACVSKPRDEQPQVQNESTVTLAVDGMI